MPDNQMKALMHLAWKRSSRDIYHLIHLYIGMWIFILLLGCFFFLNMIYNFNSGISNLPTPYIGGTTLSYILLSLQFGFLNTIAFLTFIAIIIGLLEYTVSFLVVAYYYDNCEWEIPKQIHQFFNGTGNWYNTTRESRKIRNAKEYAMDQSRLKSEIAEIKGNSKIATIQPIAPIKKE